MSDGGVTSSWITLRAGALEGNLRWLRRRLGSQTQLCSVVKGNAYGHGIETYVPLAERCGVRQFAVFSAREAQRVHACSGKRSEIMIMGDLPDAAVDWAVAEGVSFFVFDLSRLDAALQAARRVGRAARVHLEVETGLNRTGLSARSLGRALERIAAHPEQLRLDGVCSHLAGAESSTNHYRIQRQLAVFRQRVEQVRASGQADFRRHVACSAAALLRPETRLDMARVGIAQFGYWPSEEVRLGVLGARQRKRPVLRRLLTWRSRVINVKHVPSGEFIGYGHHSQALHTMRVAAVPVGYADGFPRDLGNRGRVLVHGEPCHVIGAVNMSILLVDVSYLAGVRNGDEVVLIGHQGEREITVGAFGEMFHALNYEVLLRLSADIPRIVVD